MTEPVHDQSEILTMASAFQEVANTIRMTHSVFIKMAIGIPVLLVLFMVLLTGAILYGAYLGFSSMQHQNHSIANKLETLPSDIAKAIQIHQTQSVSVHGESNPVKDLAREFMEKGRSDERLRDMGKPAISSTGSH